ncbi:MAG: hypothetical protein H6Q00_2064, partial [Holophagaceae bacterium]|nr:hypothetical protein [Holophagaceae bacterium]
MNGDHWLELLQRHSPEAKGSGWEDVIVGHDLGFLSPEAILAWAAGLPDETPSRAALLAQAGSDMHGFQAALWEACAEARGKVPRPGSYGWERAQDR